MAEHIWQVTGSLVEPDCGTWTPALGLRVLVNNSVHHFLKEVQSVWTGSRSGFVLQRPLESSFGALEFFKPLVMTPSEFRSSLVESLDGT